MNDSIYAFQCMLNALLECIKLFNTTLCALIVLLESIDPLGWHNKPDYYALNYAGMLDGGLLMSF